MYLAAKLLGRCHCADSPTTAIVCERVRMRRNPAMSSTIGIGFSASPVRRAAVRIFGTDPAARGHGIVEAPGQVRIVAGTEGAAGSTEIGVAAEDPEALLDADRLRTVVEAG